MKHPPLLRISDEQRLREMERALHAEDDRYWWRRKLWQLGFWCLGWHGVGTLFVAYALATDNVRNGTTAMGIGASIGFIGAFFTTALWFSAAKERGDL